jgi:hypothetical protein
MKKTKIVQKDCCDRQWLHGKVVMVTYTNTVYVTVTVACYLCYMLFDVHLCMYIMIFWTSGGNTSVYDEGRGLRIHKDREEDRSREVWECEGWVWECEDIGTSSMLRLTHSDVPLVNMSTCWRNATLDFNTSWVAKFTDDQLLKSKEIGRFPDESTKTKFSQILSGDRQRCYQQEESNSEIELEGPLL